jgi:hypothetical protein
MPQHPADRDIKLPLEGYEKGHQPLIYWLVEFADYLRDKQLIHIIEVADNHVYTAAQQLLANKVLMLYNQCLSISRKAFVQRLPKHPALIWRRLQQVCHEFVCCRSSLSASGHQLPL